MEVESAGLCRVVMGESVASKWRATFLPSPHILAGFFQECELGLCNSCKLLIIMHFIIKAFWPMILLGSADGAGAPLGLVESVGLRNCIALQSHQTRGQCYLLTIY